MSNIAVFPGSFDPITKGHENVVRRALPLFDKIFVAVEHNEDKKYQFSTEDRVLLIRRTFADTPNILVDTYEGLIANCCKKHRAKFLLHGLRSIADFKYERNMASINKELLPGLETIFICTDLVYSQFSSTTVRNVLLQGGDITNFLPAVLKGCIKK
jgi:pantetheine-phosphate adenylyltransferase